MSEENFCTLFGLPMCRVRRGIPCFHLLGLLKISKKIKLIEKLPVFDEPRVSKRHRELFQDGKFIGPFRAFFVKLN